MTELSSTAKKAILHPPYSNPNKSLQLKTRSPFALHETIPSLTPIPLHTIPIQPHHSLLTLLTPHPLHLLLLLPTIPQLQQLLTFVTVHLYGLESVGLAYRACVQAVSPLADAVEVEVVTAGGTSVEVLVEADRALLVGQDCLSGGSAVDVHEGGWAVGGLVEGLGGGLLLLFEHPRHSLPALLTTGSGTVPHHTHHQPRHKHRQHRRNHRQRKGIPAMRRPHILLLTHPLHQIIPILTLRTII